MPQADGRNRLGLNQAERRKAHMAIDLPKPILDYFQADQGDRGAVADCFTDAATVTDEGKTYLGRNAIREWKRASSQKYSYTVDPFSVEEIGGASVVTAHVAGNFPGSPVDLRYFFQLEHGRVASLEIKI
jgi:hypothetical protein